MKNILFEWKKMRKLRLFMGLVAATFLLIGSIYVRNALQQDLIPAKKIEHFSRFLTEVSQQNDGDQQFLQKQEDPEIEKRLEIGGSLVGSLQELQDAIENGEGLAELTLENTVYQIAAEYQEARGNFSLSQNEMDYLTRFNRELEDRSLIKEDPELSIAQPLFMRKISSLLLSPIGFLIAVLLIGASFTKEWEDRSMQFNRALPVSSTERIVARLTSYWLASLVWFIMVFGISYVLPYVGGRTEKPLFKYPFPDSERQLTEVGVLLLNAGIYTILFLLFSFTIFLLAGSFLRNTVLTVLLMAAIFAGGWLVTSGSAMSEWNPFMYQQPIHAAERQGSISLIGMIVLAVLSIVGTIFAYIADKRRAMS